MRIFMKSKNTSAGAAIADNVGGWTYILECSGGYYYVGSTKNLEARIRQHFLGRGANFTRKNPPLRLAYLEWFPRIAQAFYREKQLQGWSREKKMAIINNQTELLPELAECQNSTHYLNRFKAPDPADGFSRNHNR
jgi:putative endonuclease